LVTSSDSGSTEVLELDSAASADMVRRRWTGAGHGALQWLRQVGPRVVAWSSTAVHTLDAQPLTSPVWMEGGAFFHEVDALVLGPGGLPVVGASMGTGSRLMQHALFGPLRVMDVASPAAPQLAGAVIFDEVTRLWGTGFAFDGRYALAAETELNARLLVMDLAQRDGTFDQHLQAVASMGFPTSCLSGPLLFSAFDPLQLVGLGVNCTPIHPLPFLILVDARDPLHPSVRATGTQAVPSGNIVAVAVSDTRLLTLEGTRNTSEAYGAQMLRVYDVAAGAITEASSLAIPLNDTLRGANHFLGFDGNTAFISEAAGLLVVDVSVAPPVIRVRLPMKEPPLAAVFAAGRIYTSSHHRVSVVEPPCAPPVP
jgi:hypothetical protein